jgi:N-glycosylase/DNA lyase
MKFVSIPAPDFDLAMTLDSGQVFHWEKAGEGFVGAIGERAVYVEQHGGILHAKSGADKLDRFNRSSLRALVTTYFALDHPLDEICASFPDDPVMNAAKKSCRGLRIIRQPKWECLATFICSSMKQLVHIRQISRKLRERFGDRREVVAQIICTFPTTERIAAASEKELRACGLGYRASNLLKTARLIARGEVDLEEMSILSDVDLRARLSELPGVGPKVANCVMLFGYERLRAFPIDVWIDRVLREKYFPRARKLNSARLRAFTESYFGKHGGYAQQYLFHHARTVGRARRAGRGAPDGRARPKADVVSSQRVR